MYNLLMCPWCHVPSVILQPKTQSFNVQSCQKVVSIFHCCQMSLNIGCSLCLPATNSSTSVKSRKVGCNLCSHVVLPVSSVYWDPWLKDGYHQSSKGVLALTIFYLSFHSNYYYHPPLLSYQARFHYQMRFLHQSLSQMSCSVFFLGKRWGSHSCDYRLLSSGLWHMVW
jgi:hypothetical protein